MGHASTTVASTTATATLTFTTIIIRLKKLTSTTTTTTATAIVIVAAATAATATVTADAPADIPADVTHVTTVTPAGGHPRPGDFRNLSDRRASRARHAPVATANSSQ